MAFGNRTMSRLYAKSNGRIGGKVKGLPVLVLTVRGRKSGAERKAPVAYFDKDGAYVVVGSGGGSKETPQWFQNLAATDRARVLIGEVTRDVSVRIAEGAELKQLWDGLVLPRAAFFADYEKKSGRTIPIAVLTPTI